MDSSFDNKGFSLSPSDLDRGRREAGSSKRNSRSNKDYRISIHRYPVDNTLIDKKYHPNPSDSLLETVAKHFQSGCSCSWACFLSFITSVVPILSWLPKYKKEFILADIIAGFTIAILHIPQGMAYGVLASVKPENGLYVSFFPVLVYCMLGSSKHISIGTFAVISLMLTSAVYGSGAVWDRDLNGTHFNNSAPINASPKQNLTSPSFLVPTHLEVVTTLAITVGFMQLCMGLLCLGSLSVVLSDQLVSGFTTGAACHVAVSQLKDLFGIEIGRHSGPLSLIFNLGDICRNLVHTNLATLLISAITIFMLAICKEQIDKRLKCKMQMPLPIDLIVVVLGTTIVYFANLHTKYQVSVIKDIPTGLPEPIPPRLDIIPMLLPDGIAIAIVAFAISLSMAKLLAKKHKYEIRPNQELVALGCANIFSSFFSCYPCSASLSRSLVQNNAGGKTQAAGVVSCCILLVVLLALAPMFYTLPKCILSAIILVALKPMFLQVKDFFRVWSISKLDAAIWLVTALATILLDVTYGLLTGAVVSMLTVIFRTVIPYVTTLGRIPETDIYLDAKRYDMAEEISGMKIFHFEAALYFINRELFKTKLLEEVPLKYVDKSTKSPFETLHRIVIDCSTFSFVDLSGLEMLLEIMREYQDIGISVYLAGCSISMLQVMERMQFYEKVPLHPAVFPTVHDAVEYRYSHHNSS